MPPDRPSVPNGVIRALRQEAGFGCCVCGNPILEYHHIIPYSVDQHFRPEDMVALCPNHHEEADHGAMDMEKQRQHKSGPHNIINGCASGLLTVVQSDTTVNLGGHKFNSGEGDLLRVDGETLIGLRVTEQGALLLSLKLRDETGGLLSEIIDNEWHSEVDLPWDIEFKHRRLTIRCASRRISLDIDSQADPISIQGEIWGCKKLMKIDASGIHVEDAHFVGSGNVIGFVLEMNSQSLGFGLVPKRPIAPARVSRNAACPCGSGRKYKRCHGAIAN